MKYIEQNSYENPSFVTNHSDNQWIKKIEGWKFTGTLTFAARQPAVSHSLVKRFFGLYNYHLDGEYRWKNVPAYWRWEADDTGRLHVHFALIGHTHEFHWLRGSENEFAGANELADWMRTNWRHGKSEYAAYRSHGWLNYITKPNPIMDSCYSPPIHYLKKQALKGDGQVKFFPWLAGLYNRHGVSV